MNNFRLTGGTFFTLIINAIKKDPAREVSAKGYSNTSNPLILEDLKKMANRNYEGIDLNKSYKECCSNFKNVSSPWYLNLDLDSPIISSFRKSMLSYPRNCIVRAAEFTTKWLTNQIQNSCLANAIIELIRNDGLIDGEDNFYIKEDGSFITKQAFLDLDSIILSNLVLSCWYYVLDKNVTNEDGRDTIEYWHSNSNRFKWSEWKETSKNLCLVPGIKLNIEDEVEIDASTNSDESNVDDETIDIFDEEPNNEFVEAEVFTTKEKKETPNVVFNNYSGTQNNVVNYGNITITVGGKKNEN